MLSIIVPVYNVEKYVGRCIESLLSQSYNDVQIILVDDGSTDNSGKICDDYAERDQRIVVVHQKNAGQSAARNAGLKLATGEYITFVDSDDGIAKDTYSQAICLLIENNADVLAFGYQKVYNSDSFNSIFIPEKPECEIYSSEAAFANIHKVSLQVWNKVYKAEVLEQLRFKEGILYEDISYIQYVLMNSATIIFANFIGYYYTVAREGSTVCSFNANRIDGLKEMYNLCMYLYEKGDSFDYSKVYLQAEGFYCANYFDALELHIDNKVVHDIYQYFCAIFDIHKGRKKIYTYFFRIVPKITFLARKIGRKIIC